MYWGCKPADRGEESRCILGPELLSRALLKADRARLQRGFSMKKRQRTSLYFTLAMIAAALFIVALAVAQDKDSRTKVEANAAAAKDKIASLYSEAAISARRAEKLSAAR
jgi:hypothetical protein